MKSNIGFLQILVFILVILNAFNLLSIDLLLMVFMVIAAWMDSYLEIDAHRE